jgi:hypothetical protein
MFPSVGQTFLRCVSAALDWAKVSGLLDKVYPLGTSLGRRNADLGQFDRHWLNLGHESFAPNAIGGT